MYKKYHFPSLVFVMRKSLLKDIEKAWIPLSQKGSTGAHVGQESCCALDNLFKQVAKAKHQAVDNMA